MPFADLARQAYSFLEDSGFKLVHESSERLRYEGEQSFVAIEWDNRSGEINVSIGLRSMKGVPAFSLTDILRMEDVAVPERKMPFQVTESRLAPFLEKVAEDTRAYAQPALAGDRMFFRRLEKFRSEQSQRYMRDMELRRVRSKADKAWRAREFDKLIGLYNSIESDLSPTEQGKLDYARKHRHT